jgi:uncharacterized protein
MEEQIEMIKISRWCHKLERKKIIALFNSISLGLVFLPKEIAENLFNFLEKPKEKKEIFKKFNKDIIIPLMEENILIPELRDDIQQLVETRQRLLEEVSLELMYLLVTDGCNLRCTYCFEETPVRTKEFKPTRMTKGTAKKAIDLFAKMSGRYGNPARKKVIHLYGGEPLLNPSVVKFAILYVNKLKNNGKLPSNCEIAIVTNGTLLNDNLATFFAKNNVTVGLSIDGPREINNIFRIAKKDGISVFDETIKAYNLLKKHGAKIGLSVTLTPVAVENFDQLLSFFLDEVGTMDGISLNLLHYNSNVTPNQKHYSQAVKCQIRAFKRFRRLGIYEERIMRKARAFVNREPCYSDCGVTGSQLVIAPDGQIGVCQDFVKPRTYFQGSVHKENVDPVALGIFNTWQKRSPFFMEQCFECEALGICGGGCPASAELKTGNRWNIDERICSHSKLTLEWLIWDTYSKLTQ